MRSVQDYFFKKAKKENYLARSVYKLREINQRFHLFSSNNFILDLGAAPGSWTQYILSKISPHEKVIAIDQHPLKIQEKQVIFIQKNIFDISVNEFRQWLRQNHYPVEFDGIVSDLAPQTSGVKQLDNQHSLELAQKSFDLAQNLLSAGGYFVCKIFESPDAHFLFHQIKTCFQKSKIFKPQASRKESREFYIVAQNFLHNQ